MAGVKKSIVSGVTRMRSMSTSRSMDRRPHAPHEERQSLIPKVGAIHSYTHATGVSHSEPKRGEESVMYMPSHGEKRLIPEPRGKSKRRSSKEEPESEPSVDALTREHAKTVIRQQWHDATE
eukprot:538014_1